MPAEIPLNSEKQLTATPTSFVSGDEIGPEEKEIVIRKYGLFLPLDWSDDCEDELFRMDALWNKLVDIQKNYTIKYIETISSDLGVKRAKIAYEAASSLGATSVAARGPKRQLAMAQKAAQKRYSDELRQQEYDRREEVKVARQQSGLWWGNYNAVVRAFETGRRTAIRAGNQMRKRDRHGNGRFTNQIIGGASVERVFDKSLSQIYVAPLSKVAWEGHTRGVRRRGQMTTLTATIFVRDGERRSVTWPMMMHRPIPSNCVIKEVVVTRRLVGDRWEWSANFICSRAKSPPIQVVAASGPTAIDVGWRLVPEGLRVATIIHDGADPEFLVLDQKLLGSFHFIDELRARVKASIAEGQAILLEKRPDLSIAQMKELFTELQLRSIAQGYNSFQLSSKIGGSLYVLEENDIFFEWYKRHIKLARWLSNHQKKVVARRNSLYQNHAKRCIERSEKLAITALDLGRLVKHSTSPKIGQFFPKRAHHYRAIAAVSEYLHWIKLNCKKYGILYEEKTLPNPLPCPNCGSYDRKTRADTSPQVCAACKAVWDQDIVACRLLIAQLNSTLVASS